MRFAPCGVFLSLAVGVLALLTGSAVCVSAQSPSQSGILINLGSGLAIESSPPVGTWGSTGGYFNLISPNVALTDPNAHFFFNVTSCPSWTGGTLCTVGGSFKAGIAPLVSLNWAVNTGCRLNIWGGGSPTSGQSVRSDCAGANPEPNEVFFLSPLSNANQFLIQAWDQTNGQFCVVQPLSNNVPMSLKTCSQSDVNQQWTIQNN